MFSTESTRTQTKYYYIQPLTKHVTFEQTTSEMLYNNSRIGFIRKVKNMKTQSVNKNNKYVDNQFKIQTNNNFRLIRLYDLYGKQTDLFPYDNSQSSFINPQNYYNSFLGQSGIVEYDYLRTLFITQIVNKQGYYKYCIKRNGQYYIEQCDDYIPVDKINKKPLWGLSLQYPWQIILLKIWIKQCGGIDNIFKIQSFKFLQTFGLPQYRVYNFRKQLKFLKTQKVSQQKRKQNQQMYTLNKKNIHIIARTINSQQIKDLGLVPNSASYLIKRYNKYNQQQQGLFKIYSSLPCHWVGKYSIVNPNLQLNNIYKQQMGLDLQRNIIMTEQQLMKCFNKYYVTPIQMKYPQNYRIQDCINLQGKGQPLWIRFDIKNSGMLAMSIQLPKIKNQRNRYPQIRYFLSKYNTQQQKSKSHIRQDIPSSQFIQNMYIESTCDKWDCYRIDFVQGYHNNASFYTKVMTGHYVLFIDVQYKGKFNLRIDSHVQMTCPQIFQPTLQLRKQIFDSTFYSISQESGVQASLSQDSFDQSISLNNDFQELGFGSICIKTLSKAKQKVAMKIYPQKLKAVGLQLVSHYHQMQLDQNKQKNILLVSDSGKPQIVILQRIDNRRKSQIGQIFPPPGTVQFFKITPKTGLIITERKK